MGESVLCPSQASLIPIQRPRREGDLVDLISEAGIWSRARHSRHFLGLCSTRPQCGIQIIQIQMSTENRRKKTDPMVMRNLNLKGGEGLVGLNLDRFEVLVKVSASIDYASSKNMCRMSLIIGRRWNLCFKKSRMNVGFFLLNALTH